MLFKLLTAPVRMPISGALWVAERIHEAAEAELNDPARLKRRLVELERALEAGEIDEETFEAEELQIIRRLQDAGDGGSR